MKRSPLLSWLSRETSQMHRQLESAPLLSKLLDDSISLEEVSEVLDRFLWAYRPIDRALEASLSRFLPTYRTPLRTSLLIADLAALGQPVRKQGTMTFTPPCTLRSSWEKSWESGSEGKITRNFSQREGDPLPPSEKKESA